MANISGRRISPRSRRPQEREKDKRRGKSSADRKAKAFPSPAGLGREGVSISRLCRPWPSVSLPRRVAEACSSNQRGDCPAVPMETRKQCSCFVAGLQNIVAPNYGGHANQAALLFQHPINFKMSGTLSPLMLLAERWGGFWSPAVAGVHVMGRGILLWLIGVPIPVILLIAFWYH